MEAGELTRGRRRDLESGATALTTPDTLKIVYWGPGRSGKTTNLQWLHRRLRPEMRGRLISLDGPGERTLYFDCLPLDMARTGESPVQLRLYTVPGQPRFRLTRKLVLDGVDGIVFVWDARSRRLNANLANLIEMREAMAELGASWSQVPRVVQFNKLDLPDRIPPEELNHILDRMGERVPRVQAVATEGTGVLDTLGVIATAVLKRHRARVQPAWVPGDESL
jgi:mutual gliding-motility protein MglA